MQRRNLLRAAAAAAALPTLSACGGGGGDSDEVVARIDSFVVDPNPVALGATARVTARFVSTGTLTIIDAISHAPVPIQSGVALVLQPVYQNTLLTLGVRGTGCPTDSALGCVGNATSQSVMLTVKYSGSLLSVAGAPDRVDHVQATLKDGTIAVFGGANSAGARPSEVVRFDAAAGAFVSGGTLRSGRIGHTATVLADGTVLIVGGDRLSVTSPIGERWDPAVNASRPTSNQPDDDRSEHSATLLPDGRVLIAGGQRGSTLLDSVDIYDPVADRFTRIALRLNVARSEHVAVALGAGLPVLIVGGSTPDGAPAPAELLDVVAGTARLVALPVSETTLRRSPAIAELAPPGLAEGSTDLLIIGGETANGSALSSVLRYRRLQGDLVAPQRSPCRGAAARRPCSATRPSGWWADRPAAATPV